MHKHQQPSPSAATPNAGSRRTGVFLRTLRIARNVLAVLGVIFVYLLYTGWQQYEDRVDVGDASCSLTHCA